MSENIAEPGPSPAAQGSSRPVVMGSLAVAIVVGTTLNCVNQPGALFGGAALNAPKFLVTFVVPYLVSTYCA